jgi:hypothetical protein
MQGVRRGAAGVLRDKPDRDMKALDDFDEKTQRTLVLVVQFPPVGRPSAGSKRN